MDLLADLNESQRRAVTHVEGPLLVLAGAGSGKTLVITRRIAHLIGQGVAAWNILAVTFTNKAAGEMVQRVAGVGTARGATICTFHSLAARLLREFAEQAAVAGNFTIYDQDDQIRCVQQAMKQLEIAAANFSPRAVHSAISRAKNRLLGPAEFAERAERYFDEVVAKVYAAYEQILQANQAVDFDDLLMRTAFLFRDRPEIRQALARRYQYILIDEYQDTNHAQYVIAHGLALEHENICATGDPDQSIYGWRGADINNILEFESDYPNAVVVRLEKNYRSTQPILSAASALIAHNRRRKHKQLLAVRPGGVDVEVVRLQDDRAEAAAAAEIAAALRREGQAYRDLAIFYRVNALSRLLEEAFRSAGIPYQIARGVEFYNRKEVKDALAYLRLLVNPADDISCRRIINVPARGIGAATIGKLAAAAETAGGSLLKACSDPAAAGLAKAASKKVRAFADLMAKLRTQADSPPEQVVENVIAASGIEAALSASEDDRQALRNVQELVSAASDFHQANPDASLTDYLQQVSLVSDIDSVDAQAGAVTFMTLHTAKGLEFPAVVIIGCEQGLLPFEHPSDNDRSSAGRGAGRDMEEERRLAFVGMTRAKDRLFMTAAKYRMVRGRVCRQAESPFLSEIGGENVRRTDRTTPEQPGRAISTAKFNRYSHSRRGGFYEDVDERAIIEAMEAAERMPEQFAGIGPGRRVRHGKFGPGVVLTVSYDGERTRAVVEFDRTGRKTLILEQAHLEAM